ncbi:MAG: hypothetical protein U0838_10975 [Chloroflexota bacterium]
MSIPPRAMTKPKEMPAESARITSDAAIARGTDGPRREPSAAGGVAAARR